MGWLLGTVLFLAFTNGANDTFKGVATLFGSRTTDYRSALWWAVVTTLAGSLAAVLLSGGLIEAFSGKGLVPEPLVHDRTFLLAIGLGASLTVLGATFIGMPISTTHAMTGALVGAGVASSGSMNVARLGYSFFLPLAVSPFLSFLITSLLYPAFRTLRLRLGVERQMCLCLGDALPQAVQIRPDGTAVLRTTGAILTVGQLQACRERYAGRVVGIDVHPGLIAEARFAHRGVPRLAFEVGDLARLGYAETFDIVTAARVLQWLANPSNAL